MRQVGVLDQADRGVDGGMRRGAQEQELGGAEAQHLAAGGVGAFQRPFDQRPQHDVDLAQAAERRGQQQAHERTVARIEAGEACVPGQGLVERLALVEAGDQDFDGGLPGGEWGELHRAAL